MQNGPSPTSSTTGKTKNGRKFTNPRNVTAKTVVNKTKIVVSVSTRGIHLGNGNGDGDDDENDHRDSLQPPSGKLP
ncbi:unnamed protein product [Linum trigynum]|uniref:Uncharacterized protein n=1 Tax=Linum trigynum TaxID=586398 RepID=A0AAV2G4D9_9ROSI